MQALSDSPVIAHRRQLARSVRLASRHQGERESLHSPRFNLREITKHLILLEDHLTHRLKVCPDCIRKHLLTVEALAEEVESLVPGTLEAKVGGAFGELCRMWLVNFEDGKPLPEIATDIRQLRKQMAEDFADPRVSDEGPHPIKKASLLLARKCPHRG